MFAWRTFWSMTEAEMSFSVKTRRILQPPPPLMERVSSWRYEVPRNSSGMISLKDSTRFSQPSRTIGLMGTWSVIQEFNRQIIGS